MGTSNHAHVVNIESWLKVINDARQLEVLEAPVNMLYTIGMGHQAMLCLSAPTTLQLAVLVVLCCA